ncbi:MAG: HAD-IA family hydrolase, partial [Pseudomonadales bacterium]
EIGVAEFDELFAMEARQRGHEIPGRQVLALLSGDLRPQMVDALKAIKTNFDIGCITNNVNNAGEGPGMARDPERASSFAEVMALFDVIIESSKVGIRKPNPGIYQIACKQLNIAPTEAVFLDDLGINLKPARELGMRTIKVLNPDQALAELGAHLDMQLI